MINLKELQSINPELDELMLESSGYGMWSVWQGEANPVIAQTLEDYGGVEVLRGNGQALWFFFSVDVFLAAAKLSVWAQFNALPVTMQVFQAKVKCSPRNQYRIEFADDLWAQDIDIPVKFQVYADADVVTASSALSSLAMNDVEKPKGFAARSWKQVVADARVSHKAQQGWYCVLRPITVHQDKNFLIGWRDFYEKIENILQRNKLKHTVYDNYLMMPMSSLRQLKQWCRDYLNLIARLKNEENGAKYWPCVMAFRDSKGVSFNNDLPRQFGLDWDSLMPDSPYMPLQDAVLLGSGFEIHESHLSLGQKTP
ncbi:tetratricopeptide repeat protein, partial [Desulfovibrio sp. OttesenSCG-928-C06]|nr:tetratricopeptide repeat protein [Desulfovibrio sp. OttesenSCG-928-C06]